MQIGTELSTPMPLLTPRQETDIDRGVYPGNSIPNPRYSTIQYLLSPVNLSGHLVTPPGTNKYVSQHEPFYNLMFSIINTILVTSYIYCLFHVFHDRYFGLMVSGTYLFICVLVGLIIGPIDDLWIL